MYRKMLILNISNEFCAYGILWNFETRFLKLEIALKIFFVTLQIFWPRVTPIPSILDDFEESWRITVKS